MNRYFIISIIFILILGACTSSEKYHDLEVHDHQLQDSLKMARRLNHRLQRYIDDNFVKVYRTSSSTRDRSANSRHAAKRMSTEMINLNECRDYVATLKNQLKQQSERVNLQEKKLIELQATPKSVGKRPLARLNDKMSKAMESFKKEGLDVTINRGRLLVTVPNEVLFESGKIKISHQGKNTLAAIALVLQAQDQYYVQVEGHTDDVPVSDLGKIKDNWELSAMRATSVARELVADGIEPDMVIAAGRGEFSPIGDNKTAPGRKKNRRTEIILLPVSSTQ